MDRAPAGDGAQLGGGARAVLHISAFRRLLFALALSSFGDWLGFLATTALATQLADSFQGKAYATGAVLVFRLLPAVLFGPVAGAFADRFDRRRTMVVSDLARFALFVSIPLSRSLVWLVVATFLVETFGLFWIPAKEASVPNLVGRERLESANQLSLIATYGSAPVAAVVFALLGLVTRALSGRLAFFTGRPVDLALYVDAATYLFAAATIWRLDIPSPQGRRDPTERPPTLLGSLREGIAFARTSALVRGLLVGMLGALAAGGVVIATGQLFATEVLHGGPSAYGLLFGAVFIGLAAGMALGPRVLGDLSRRRALGPTIVGAGAPLVVLALVPNLGVAVLFTALTGAFAGVAYVLGLTLLGLEVSDEFRGRAFGLVQSLMRIDLLLVTSLTPFVVGAIGRRSVPLPGDGPAHVTFNGVQVVLLLGGLLGIAVGVLAFRQMDDRPGVPLAKDLLGLLRRRGHSSTHAGLLVAFEGGEGAGKSTQVALLEAGLRDLHQAVLATREPGATPAGARVRALLLDADSALAPRTEALLYAADRAQHVATVVRPALDAGVVVVTDRYVDSSLAYQSAGRTLDRGEVARLSDWATQGLRPGLTVLLDVDPVVGLPRAARTGAPDRIEAESLAFHQRVRRAFLELAAADPDRYLVLEADAPPGELAAAVRERLRPLLAGLPAPVAPPDAPPPTPPSAPPAPAPRTSGSGAVPA